MGWPVSHASFTQGCSSKKHGEDHFLFRPEGIARLRSCVVEIPIPGVGSVGFSSDTAESFDSNTIEILTRFAGLIGLAWRRAEDFESLQQSEEEFRWLVESAGDALFLHDAELNFLTVNQEACDSLGYSREELLRMGAGDIFANWDRGQIIELVRAIPSGSTITAEGYHRRKDGSEFLVEVRISRYERQARTVFLALARDVTEQDKAEEAVRESEARLRLVTEQSPGLLWTTDLDLVITSAAGNAIAGIGLQPVSVVGMRIQDFFDELATDEPALVAHQDALAGRSVSYEQGYRGRWFRGHVQPLRDVKGVIVGVVGFSLDVTEQREAEEERDFRLKLEESLGRVSDQLLAADDFSDFRTPWNQVVQELNSLGIPASGTSMQVPSERPDYYQVVFQPGGELHNREARLADYPWVKLAWDSGEPLIATVQEYPDNPHFSEELKALVEVPIAGLGSVAVCSPEPGAFDDRAVHAVKEFAGLICLGYRRVLGLVLLQASEGRFRSLFEFSADAVFVEDLEGTVLDVNPAACQLHQMTRDELVGKNLLDLVPPDHRETAARDYLKLASGELNAVEGLSYTSEGQTIPVELRTNRFQYEGKEVLLLQARDISVRKQAAEALRRSEEELRWLVESAGDALFLHDAELNFLTVNQEACNSLGYSREELLGMGVGDIVSDWDEDQIREMVNAIPSGSTITAEGHHRRKDGSEFLVEVRISSYERQGRTVFLSLARDVTEQDNAEEAVRDSEAMLREAEQIAHIGTFKLNPVTGGLTWSDEMHRIFGIPKEGFDGSLDRGVQAIHQDDRARAVRVSQSAMQKGESYEVDYRIVLPNGAIRHLVTKADVRCDESGQAQEVVGTVQDITERKQAELAVRDSEAELSAIYENAPFMMFLLDEEGRVHKANRAAARFSDRNADETVELTHGDALRCVNSMQDPRGCGFGESCQYCTVRTTAQDTIENGHTNRGVEALIQVGVEGKQEELNFLVSSGPVEVSGRQMSLLCMEDITERKMAENALRFSEGRFRKLVENSYDGISIFNRISDGRASRRKLNYCNQQYVKMSGRTREELMAADDIGEFLLDQRPSLQNADDTGRLNSSLAVMGISSWKRPDDLENYHEWVMVPLVIEDEPLIMSIDRDITESKLAEDAVQESEEKFRALFEEAPDSVLLIDTEKGEIVDFNDRAHERLGYTRKEFQKLELDDIEAVESPEEVAVHIEKVAKDGRDSFETKHRTKDGKILDVLVNVSTIQLQERKFFVSIWTDITERRRAEEEIAKLARFTSENPSPVIRISSDGMVLYSNEAADPILAHCNHVRGRPLVGPCRQLVEQTLTSGQSLEKEIECDNRTFSLTIAPVIGSGYANIYGLDITARKLAQAKVVESEEEYRTLFEASRDAIMTGAPPTWQFSSGNPATVEMFGAKDEEEFVSKFPWELSPEYQPDGQVSSDKARMMIDKAMSDGSHYFEWTHQRIGGEVFPATVLLTRMEVAGQQSLQATVRDITEQKRGEDALRQSEEALREAQHIGHMGSWERNLTTDEAAWSDEQYRLFGYEPEEVELTREFFLSRVHDEDRQAVLHAWDRLLASESPVDFEYRFLRKDGEIRHGQARAVSEKDESGEVVRFLGTFQDLTERRQMEAEVLETNNRLQEALNHLEQAQEKLVEEERLRAVGTMAGGIAHDFNNSLSTILGFTELLLDSPDQLADTEKAREFLELIRTDAEDAAAVVSRLRDFYRKREDDEILVAVRLSRIVEDAILLTRPLWREQARARGIEFKIETDLPELPVIAGNASELRTLVSNLVINATQSMDTGGAIWIRLRQEGPGEEAEIVLEVEDNGPGMTEEVRQRCLDPFFTTRGASGTGLGLSGVHGIARRHRASLEIESELGQGALIRIRFKVSQGAEVRHVSESPAVGVKPLHILVVEDEINQRNLYQMLLVAQGHTVVTAADGREGLARFSEEPFDLVITDQSMPGMSGEQLGRAIKSTSDVPIILLTGFGFLMDDPPEGIDEVLSKPITQETLLTMVKKAIDS